MGPLKEYLPWIMAFLTTFNSVKFWQFHSTTAPLLHSALPHLVNYTLPHFPCIIQ